ncbi:MAG: pyridoxamine 5'-phosphate oxidase family protein [Candidatus Magasanikbacteria bacterium]|nr:pyridoxamine 5'-phosphate oxidase family protein [Candidatus Magasanikbacteria bacterium]
MNKKITEKDILKFLKKQFIMQIATISKNKPHASVILYYVDKDFNFYFTTHKNSYKSKNLLKNKKISFTIWKHDKILVQADGVVSIIKNTKEKYRIYNKLIKSASIGKNFWPPLFHIKGKKYIVFKIKPQWMRILNLSEKTITSKTSPFTEIKF